MSGKIIFTWIVTALLTQNVSAQFNEINGAELESLIFTNHEKGVSGHEGLFCGLSFSVEDFNRLTDAYSEISEQLKVQFDYESLELNTADRVFVLFYEKKKAETDDVLKILKNILGDHNVYLTGYTEKTFVKK